MWRIVFFSFISLLTHAAETLPEIQWLRMDYPPGYILSGPYKDRGYADVRDKFIMQELADFSHRQAVSNVARLMEEFRNRPNVCNTSMQKTPERETFMVFSEPVAKLLPNGLIILASKKDEIAPFLNEHGEVRLEALLSAQKFKVAVAAGRSYGVTIDAILQPGRTSGVVVPYFKGDVFASGLLQLHNGSETDATVGYAIELNWFAQRLHLKQADFQFLPVEGATQTTYSHVACSRSPLGDAVITRVNELIRTGRLTALSERAYLDWLPVSVKPYYEKIRKTR